MATRRKTSKKQPPTKFDNRTNDTRNRTNDTRNRTNETRIATAKAAGILDANGELTPLYAEDWDAQGKVSRTQWFGPPKLSRRSRPSSTTKTKRQAPRIGKARLAEMIEEATVDAYGESEQTTGWFTVIEENLALPFETTVLGVQVQVERIDLDEAEHIVAICRRGRDRQAVLLLDLPLPTPPPAGADWIEAYRHWSRGA